MFILAVSVALLVLSDTPPKISQSHWETASVTKARPSVRGQFLARMHPSAVAHPQAGSLALPGPLPDGDDLQPGMQAVRWARRDPIGAALWAEKLPDGSQRMRVISALAAAWAEENPQVAAQIVMAWELPDVEAKAQATVSVVSAWAMTDPLAAAQWVETFSAGRGRDYAIENVAFQWMQSDPAALLAWVQRLPNETDRDSAINAGVGALVESDPDMALLLSEVIGNAGIRQRQMDRAARRWLETDLAAARSWIIGSSLPAEVKQRLLAQAQPNSGP